jgi:hypothetical protein
MLAKCIGFLFKTLTVVAVMFGGSFLLIFLFTKMIITALGMNPDAVMQIAIAVWLLAWGIKITKSFMGFEWLFGNKTEK